VVDGFGVPPDFERDQAQTVQGIRPALRIVEPAEQFQGQPAVQLRLLVVADACPLQRTCSGPRMFTRKRALTVSSDLVPIPAGLKS
jgi:hypothetical protein